MIKIARILHPTDFTDNSKQAGAYAGFLAQQFDAELHVLHVLEGSMDRIPAPGEGFPPPGESRGVSRDEASEMLSESVGIQCPADTPVVLATRLGMLSEQIVSYAEEKSVSMIVMGTHGRSGLAHMVVGSVAEGVVRKAACPVLTVRPQPEGV